jgi:hypothetical protein
MELIFFLFAISKKDRVFELSSAGLNVLSAKYIPMLTELCG